MNEVDTLIQLLKNKAKLVAMLAPSFPIVYKYPEIISRLKNLGFSYVVEVAAGAKKTNEMVRKLLQENPKSRYITSPCPSFVRMIRTKHAPLIPYLAVQADSPMVATAKIVKDKYPGYQPVFIGPCIVKKLEASEDYPDLNILVLTYKELDTVFNKLSSSYTPLPINKFDIEEQSTRIYPIDGGLSISSKVSDILKPDEILVVSGWKDCVMALMEFQQNTKIRLLDILFCEGGCINGPGIVSNLSLNERKKKIMEYSK